MSQCGVSFWGRDVTVICMLFLPSAFIEFSRFLITSCLSRCEIVVVSWIVVLASVNTSLLWPWSLLAGVGRNSLEGGSGLFAGRRSIVYCRGSVLSVRASESEKVTLVRE